MSSSSQVGTRVRIACMSLASAWMPLAAASVVAGNPHDGTSCGRSEAIEVALPLELQASLFHSLPIAGLLVTPDAIAERVLLNPRLRATASQPSSGKGAAYLIPESSVVSTRADPPD